MMQCRNYLVKNLEINSFIQLNCINRKWDSFWCLPMVRHFRSMNFLVFIEEYIQMRSELITRVLKKKFDECDPLWIFIFMFSWTPSKEYKQYKLFYVFLFILGCYVLIYCFENHHQLYSIALITLVLSINTHPRDPFWLNNLFFMCVEERYWVYMIAHVLFKK
jgi:hypothetical protein